MKLWIWSDLHLECQGKDLPAEAPAGPDIIVCAGDLCHAPDLASTAKGVVDRYGLPMVFVPGNHEYYRGNYPRHSRSMAVDRMLMAEAAEASRNWACRLHLLDDGVVEVGGVRFLGSTLWTDFTMGSDDPVDVAWRINDARSLSPDFRHVRHHGDHMLSPQDMLAMNAEARRFLLGEMAKPFDGPTVAVTHFLPHPAATPSAYQGDPANFMYACGEKAFGALLESRDAPALWVCGHTHHPVNVEIGRTRIVCNPAGFSAAPDERDGGFRWDFVVEVGPR